MAILEIYKAGQLVTRRHVDPDQARAGIQVDLDNHPSVHLTLGDRLRTGQYEILLTNPISGETLAPEHAPPAAPPSASPALPSAPTLTSLHVTPPQPNPAPPTLSPADAPVLDGYEMHSRLGEGGMGVVWKATQLSTHRPVAIKFLAAGALRSQRAQQRFAREVELCARLEHPNIARIYESGLHQGVYYYAMELVDGSPLDDYVRHHRLDSRQILQLMEIVCQALQVAHQRGVIHRDLKPSNILVDSAGQPHILDFGLAKVVATHHAAATPNVTMDGDCVGTPAFMSPEQAAGEADTLDLRTDVYSLGVILYQLLTGQSPHPTTGNYYELLKRVVEDDVVPPRQVQPNLDRDLEALLLKALAREPRQRYASAGDMADDIHNYLSSEPLTARPATITYYLGKRVRKHRVPVASALAVLAVLALLTFVAYRWVTAERRRADALAAQAGLQARQTTTQAALAEERLHDAQRQEHDNQMLVAQQHLARAEALLQENRPPAALQAYGQAYDQLAALHAPTFPAELGLWETYRALPLLTVTAHNGPVTSVALADRGLILSGSEDGSVKLWDASTGRLVNKFLDHGPPVRTVAITPDAGYALAGGDDKIVRLWQVSTGRLLQTFEGHSWPITRVLFTWLDDRFLALSASKDRTIRTWNMDTGQCTATLSGHDKDVSDIAAYGHLLLSASADETVRLWDLSTAQELRTLTRHYKGATCVTFSPDGASALSGGRDGQIKVCDVATGKELNHFPAVTGGAVTSIVPTPCGPLSGGTDKTARLWEFVQGSFTQARPITGFAGPLPSIAVNLHSNLAVISGFDRTFTLWNLAEPRSNNFGDWGVTVSADGCIFAARNRDMIDIGDIATGLILRSFHIGDGAAALSLDGRTLLSGGGTDEPLQLWDLSTGHVVRSFPRHTAVLNSIALDAAARTAVTTGRDNTVRLLDLTTGDVTELRPRHDRHVWCVALSPDGHTALSAGEDGTIKVWDTAAKSELRTLRGHKGHICSLAFVPGGHTALSASDDKTVILWDWATGQALRTLEGHTDAVRNVAATADGRSAFSAGDDGNLKFWDLDTGAEIRTLHTTHGPMSGAASNAHGLLAVSAGRGWGRLVWDFSTGAALRALEPQVKACTTSNTATPLSPEDSLALGRWWALHHRWDWALNRLEAARDGGAKVPSLLLARGYWCTRDRSRAQTEFEQALQAKEAPEYYLRLCLAALTQPLPHPIGPSGNGPPGDGPPTTGPYPRRPPLRSGGP